MKKIIGITLALALCISCQRNEEIIEQTPSEKETQKPKVAPPKTAQPKPEPPKPTEPPKSDPPKPTEPPKTETPPKPAEKTLEGSGWTITDTVAGRSPIIINLYIKDGNVIFIGDQVNYPNRRIISRGTYEYKHPNVTVHITEEEDAAGKKTPKNTTFKGTVDDRLMELTFDQYVYSRN